MSASKSTPDFSAYASKRTVKEGHMNFYVRDWEDVYMKLYDDGMVFLCPNRTSPPSNAIKLHGGFMVGESRMATNAIQITDRIKTIFFATDSRPLRREWIQAFDSVLSCLLPEGNAVMTGLASKSTPSQQKVTVHREVTTTHTTRYVNSGYAEQEKTGDDRVDDALAAVMKNWESGNFVGSGGMGQGGGFDFMQQPAPAKKSSPPLPPRQQKSAPPKSAPPKPAPHTRTHTKPYPTPNPAPFSSGQVKPRPSPPSPVVQSAPPVAVKKSAPPPVAVKKSAPPPVAVKKSAPPPVAVKKSAPPPVAVKKSAPPPVAVKKSAPPVAPMKKSAPPAPAPVVHSNPSSRLVPPRVRRSMEGKELSNMLETAKQQEPPPKPSKPVSKNAPPPPAKKSAPLPPAKKSAPPPPAKKTAPPPPAKKSAPPPPAKKSAPPPPPPGSKGYKPSSSHHGSSPSQSDLVSMWDSQAKQTTADLKRNPFSEHFDPSEANKRLSKSKYGRPVSGSLTALRAAKAKDWFEQQLLQFMEIMDANCEPGADGRRCITFAHLFELYETVSDSLVGMMQRAKKRGMIDYEGEMLFQGRDDGVLVYIID